MTSTLSRPHDSIPPVQTVVESEEDVQTLLDVLDDADSRMILEATADEALTAGELAEECDLALSTTYRKLDQLTAAGLLAERTRVRISGKHTSEYFRIVEDIVVSAHGDGGIEVSVSRTPASSPAPPGPRWSEVDG